MYHETSAFRFWFTILTKELVKQSTVTKTLKVLRAVVVWWVCRLHRRHIHTDKFKWFYMLTSVFILCGNNVLKCLYRNRRIKLLHIHHLCMEANYGLCCHHLFRIKTIWGFSHPFCFLSCGPISQRNVKAIL